jgi:hypothetical protein
MGPITFVGAASLPTDGPHALGRALLVFAGGLLETTLVLVAWRVDPERPERVAVARVYRSIAAWLAPGPDGRRSGSGVPRGRARP